MPWYLGGACEQLFVPWYLAGGGAGVKEPAATSLQQSCVYRWWWWSGVSSRQRQARAGSGHIVSRRGRRPGQTISHYCARTLLGTCCSLTPGASKHVKHTHTHTQGLESARWAVPLSHANSAGTKRVPRGAALLPALPPQEDRCWPCLKAVATLFTRLLRAAQQAHKHSPETATQRCCSSRWRPEVG